MKSDKQWLPTAVLFSTTAMMADAPLTWYSSRFDQVEHYHARHVQLVATDGEDPVIGDI